MLIFLILSDYEYPPDTRGKKLVPTPKVPQYPPTMRPFKMQKKLRLMRGPELIFNKLQHRQYGVIVRQLNNFKNYFSK